MAQNPRRTFSELCYQVSASAPLILTASRGSSVEAR